MFYYVLTPEVREICREIDRITVKGSNQPIRIYTVDIDTNNLEETNDRFKTQSMKEKKRNYEKEKKHLWHSLKTRKRTTAALITGDKDFQELRRHVNPVFTHLFQRGYQHYLDGDWESAQSILQKCIKTRPSDGPTKTLLNIIAEGGGKAPEKWKGFRALISK